MSIFRLDERVAFPPPHLADADGLLAVGGDLRPERLLLAYASGIFPWPTAGLPLLWHSPHPRFVVLAPQIHVPRSLQKTIRQRRFEVRLDTAFEAVVQRCGAKPRPGQDGTWITPEMHDAYVELHRLGFAHSAEAWRDGHLVGGLYGVSLGAAYFGESMFADEADASKVAFAVLARQLARWGMGLVDCQVYTEHLARFGAEPWPRPRYLAALRTALETPTRRGPWRLEESFAEVGGSRTEASAAPAGATRSSAATEADRTTLIGEQPPRAARRGSS